MSADEKGETAMYRVTIAAPIETVWNELVKTDEALPFFFGAVCRTPNGLQPGAPMAMQTKNGKFTSVVGRVLEFSPPHRYAHTLKFTHFDDAPVTITYDLKEIEDGTQFTLTTSGVIPNTKTAKSMGQGGPFIVNTLKNVAETGRPSVGGAMMLAVIGLMQPFTPGACRSDNWPFETIKTL